MFTFMSLWIRPYWDLADWSVSLHYQDSEGAKPLVMGKEGTLALPGDVGPAGLLAFVGRRLEEERAATRT